MEHLLVGALLLLTVAANPDQWQQWQQSNPRSPSFGGPPRSKGRPPLRPDGGNPWSPYGGQPMGGGQGSAGPMGGGQGFAGPMSGGPMRPGWNMDNAGNPTRPNQRPQWLPQPPAPGQGSGPRGQQPPMGASFNNPQFGGPQENPGSNPWGGRKFSRRPGRGPWGGQRIMGRVLPTDLPPRPGVDFDTFDTYSGQGPVPRSKGRGRGPRRGGRPNPRNPIGRRPGGVPLQPSVGPNGGAPFEGLLFGGEPLTPEMIESRQFIPIIKAENVTVQNISDLPLKEGENVFLLPQAEMRPPPKGSQNAPQNQYGYGYGLQPYLKLIYNPTATQKVSFEYGIAQYFPSFMKAEPEADKEN